METIAIYWEPEIKIYGLIERAGLTMISLRLSPQNYGLQQKRIYRAAGEAGNLALTFAAMTEPGRLQMHLLFEKLPEKLVEAFTETAVGSRADLTVESDVEMIYFNGPHFGDRYGIADVAFQALTEADVPVLAAACSSASVYVVLPPQTAGKARRALAKSFSLPGG